MISLNFFSTPTSLPPTLPFRHSTQFLHFFFLVFKKIIFIPKIFPFISLFLFLYVSMCFSTPTPLFSIHPFWRKKRKKKNFFTHNIQEDFFFSSHNFGNSLISQQTKQKIPRKSHTIFVNFNYFQMNFQPVF